MDRLKTLQINENDSTDSSLESSLSDGFKTADEGAASKYYSLNDSDIDLDNSSPQKISLDCVRDDGKVNDSVSEISKNSKTINEISLSTTPSPKKIGCDYKTENPIDTSNIVAEDVNLFDHNENSYDEHDLIIDDNACIILENESEEFHYTEKNLNPYSTLKSDLIVATETDTFSQCKLVDTVDAISEEKTKAPDEEIAEIMEPSTNEVILQIDGKNVDAIDIGNGLFLYRKDGNEELTAIQLLQADDGQSHFKFLKVRQNEDGNLEVYEEQTREVPIIDLEKDTSFQEMDKSDEVSENKVSHLPIKDLNKVISINEFNTSNNKTKMSSGNGFGDMKSILSSPNRKDSKIPSLNNNKSKVLVEPIPQVQKIFLDQIPSYDTATKTSKESVQFKTQLIHKSEFSNSQLYNLSHKNEMFHRKTNINKSTDSVSIKNDKTKSIEPFKSSEFSLDTKRIPNLLKISKPPIEKSETSCNLIKKTVTNVSKDKTKIYDESTNSVGSFNFQDSDDCNSVNSPKSIDINNALSILDHCIEKPNSPKDDLDSISISDSDEIVDEKKTIEPNKVIKQNKISSSADIDTSHVSNLAKQNENRENENKISQDSKLTESKGNLSTKSAETEKDVGKASPKINNIQMSAKNSPASDLKIDKVSGPNNTTVSSKNNLKSDKDNCVYNEKYISDALNVKTVNLDGGSTILSREEMQNDSANSKSKQLKEHPAELPYQIFQKSTENQLKCSSNETKLSLNQQSWSQFSDMCKTKTKNTNIIKEKDKFEIKSSSHGTQSTPKNMQILIYNPDNIQSNLMKIFGNEKPIELHNTKKSELSMSNPTIVEEMTDKIVKEDLKLHFSNNESNEIMQNQTEACRKNIISSLNHDQSQMNLEKSPTFQTNLVTSTPIGKNLGSLGNKLINQCVSSRPETKAIDQIKVIENKISLVDPDFYKESTIQICEKNDRIINTAQKCKEAYKSVLASVQNASLNNIDRCSKDTAKSDYFISVPQNIKVVPTGKKDSDVLSIDSIDSDNTADSFDATDNSHLNKKSKHQRKQILTPAHTSDIEIVFPVIDEDYETNQSKVIQNNLVMAGFPEIKKTSPKRKMIDTELKNPISPKKKILAFVSSSEKTQQESKIPTLNKEIGRSKHDILARCKPDSFNVPIKRGRGRPRKSFSALESPIKHQRLLKQQTSLIDLKSLEHEDSGDDGEIIQENWTLGKINQNIICPICNKLFRSENVIFKHVKHCAESANCFSFNKLKGLTNQCNASTNTNYKQVNLDKSSTNIEIQDYISSKVTVRESSMPSLKSDILEPRATASKLPIPLNCEIINNTLTTDNENNKVVTEMKTNCSNISKLVCKECGKTFKQYSHLAFHQNSHNREKSKNLTQKTVITPNIQGMLTCETCNKGFRQLHHLVEHKQSNNCQILKEELNSKNTKQCDSLNAQSCSDKKETIQSPNADDHSFSDNRCEQCNKSFRKPYHLAEHRQTHEGTNRLRMQLASPRELDTPKSKEILSCEKCGKTFRKLHHMIEHRELHSDSKDDGKESKPKLLAKDIIHECPLCYMVFPNEPSLTKHVSICQKKKSSPRMRHSRDSTSHTDNEEKNGTSLSNKSAPLRRPSKRISNDDIGIVTSVPPKINKEDSKDINLVKKSQEVPNERNENIVKNKPELTKGPLRKSSITKDSTLSKLNKKDNETRYMINPYYARETKSSKLRKALTLSKVKDELANDDAVDKCKDTNENTKPSSHSFVEDENMLYSFPKQKLATESSKAIPKKILPKNQAGAAIFKKPIKVAPSQKRKSLVGIARKKSLPGRPKGLKMQNKCCDQVFLNKVDLEKHKKLHKESKLKFTHLCDCGEVFSSAILLAQHATVSHTPPRVRRDRLLTATTAAHSGNGIPNPDKSQDSSKPNANKSQDLNCTSNSSKSQDFNKPTPSTSLGSQKKPDLLSSVKKEKGSVKKRTAHSSVPVPKKMASIISRMKF